MPSAVNWDERLAKRLMTQDMRNLYRERNVMEGAQGPSVRLEGKEYISFCSNDYLSLANHPGVLKAFKSGVDQYGVGSGASHLISGHSAAHHDLEVALAEFTGRDQALLFSSGYMANVGVLTTLMEEGDVILSDRLNHVSLNDGARLSSATLRRYLHVDINSLQQKLLKDENAKKLIVSDGVFSMDGDIAPLKRLSKVAQQNHAWLMVDDAHGMGVLGNNGAGSLDHHKMGQDDVQILMATLGKSIGVSGAFVAGSKGLIDCLIQFSKNYCYTTAMPPALAVAAKYSLGLVKKEHWRREKLRELIRQFKQGAEQLGLQLLPSETPVQPLIIGDAQQAVILSNQLKQKGLLVPAIRAPSVPKGEERMRISLCAGHSDIHVDKLLSAISEFR